ncbi:hypothetical protein HMPREF3185_00237 [Porphyromonas somerae]|uniref:Uncharacterized protein n=1 Tax=Porphyromonas somerae TaxID=322095 RepID=A0A134BE18_9PORP|nr:hypothetical protein HMPREF3184_00237 [Porphyromonadaceae bacterium KA00676]KXB78207.1 hypothetical protein HMPREF3185_00237 [Porphyromonas somerae]
MGRAEWCVITPILGGLDNRKEVGEGELVKVVSPLHGAGIGSLTYEMVVRDMAVAYSSYQEVEV